MGLLLCQGGLSLTSPEWYAHPEQPDKRVAALKKLISSTLRLLSPGAAAEAAGAAERIVRFETQLAALHVLADGFLHEVGLRSRK